MKERGIIHDRGTYFVLKEGKKFLVMKNTAAHSESDSVYADSSLAIARCDYLAKYR